MSTIRTAVFQVLSSNANLVAAVPKARMFHGTADQDPTLPYLVIQQISGVRVHSAAGVNGRSQARIQVTAWAETLPAADVVSELVRQALDGYRGTSGSVVVQGTFLENDIDLIPPPSDGTDRPTYGKALDFLIGHEETTP